MTLTKGNAATVRLLVIVADDCDTVESDIIRALAAHERYQLEVITVQCPRRPEHLSVAERIYRALDRRAFGRPANGRAEPRPSVENADLCKAVRQFKPSAVVDLTGALTATVASLDVPTVGLHFEGRPARLLWQAVRQRLGVPHGTLRVRAVLQGASSPRLLYSAACYIDHRSLVRSVDLVVRKVPMIVQAALCRMKHAYDAQADPESTVSPPRALGVARLLWRLAASTARFILRCDQWKVLIYRDQVKDRLGKPWVSPHAGTTAFWADPFVVPHAEGAVLFFEDVPLATGRGRICLLEIDHEGRYGGPIVALDKPWHLSYPFIFEWKGGRYLIPESSANRTVDLYECVQFPRQWRHVTTLIRGSRLADATIIHWQGRLWMFAADGPPDASNYDELHLFWANDLMGPWHPHELNPVKIDAGSARPAGAMFVDQGRLIRPTQDCRNRYGGGVVFQEVVVLDERHFEERVVDRLAPVGVSPGDAFHTYNASGRYTAIDVARSTWRWRFGRH